MKVNRRVIGSRQFYKVATVMVAGTLSIITSALLTSSASAQSNQPGMSRPASQRPSYPASAPLEPVSQGGAAGTASPNTISPAGCYVNVDNAHISQYYLNLGIRAAKVNAYISCNLPVSNMTLQVQLWKTGAIWDYLQAQTQTTEPSGTYLANTGTWIKCANLTQSTFYGDANATVWENGVQYSASVQSASYKTLACGT